MTVTEQMTVLTIGHSTHTIERFIDLLRASGVTAIADVRSSPFSRFNPQFNRDVLSASLREGGISYVFVGKELGARSQDKACYINGQVQYDRLAQTPLFKSGIKRVIKGSEKFTVALMCAEKEPLDCHRTLLVGRALEAQGIGVAHILPDGAIEPHDDTMLRLLDIVGLPRSDMFKSRAELIDAACRLREQKVAFIDSTLADQANP